MEIIIIVGAIGSVIAYICLSTKTQGEIAQKRNPGFKSSLRHNPELQNSEEVFKVLQEANLHLAFLDSELNKHNNTTLTDTTLTQSYLSKIRADRGNLFNPQSKDNRSPLKVAKAGIRKVDKISVGSQTKDNRSPLKVAKAGIRKVDKISVESQKDIFDSINPDLLSQLIETHQFDQRQNGPRLVKKRIPPRNTGNK